MPCRLWQGLLHTYGGEPMLSLTDKEIMKASDSIDKALASATRENRGEIALRIVMVARNLNDHIADKIWKDIRPNEPRDINKVARFFNNIPQYKFISRFNTFLQASVSHFTPSEEGAERLMIKYYRYLLKLKKVMYDRYGVTILKNIDKFQAESSHFALSTCPTILLLDTENFIVEIKLLGL